MRRNSDDYRYFEAPWGSSTCNVRESTHCHRYRVQLSTTTHNPYWRYACMGGTLTLLSDSEWSSLTMSTLSVSFPIYILLRKSFKEWELQCNSLGRKGGNAELAAGGSLSWQVNPGEMFPASEQSVNLRQDQEQCYLMYLAAKASFPFLLREVSPYPLRWVLWVLTHYERRFSSKLIEALPNWVLFPFGWLSVSFTAKVSHLFFSWTCYIWLY